MSVSGDVVAQILVRFVHQVRPSVRRSLEGPETMSRKVGDSNAAGDAMTGCRQPEHAESTTRKAYMPPRLTRYGNVRDLTAAPSPGAFESGRGTGFRA
jgi:hypothetical protein